MQAVVDRRHGDIQVRGDFSLGKGVDVEEPGDLALGVRQGEERLLQLLFALLDFETGGRTSIVRCDPIRCLGIDDRLFFPAGHAVAVGEEDAAQPARKGEGLLQLIQLQIRLDKRFLGDVFGEVEVSQHGVRVSNRHLLEALDECAVRFHISLAGLLGQCFQLIHVATPRLSEGLLPVKDPPREGSLS